ncbi:trafficking protein particle complex subunit 4-like [Macadamia integrifolia]|uniref:trafficking protein particle complex subunit 4-like n=1 Tax=Macadamia integrifolia TaxID=60698 RepID=UPI001C4FDEF5|nr:trafficking protein particle complex subunit 4-like [Macadamia integrifolia]
MLILKFLLMTASLLLVIASLLVITLSHGEVKKQVVVAHLSAEAEFRTMAHGICELLWLYGLLTDLFILALNSVEKGNLGVPQLPGQGCSFHSFRSNTYKLSFMESPSGIKIILVTHPKTGDLRESLKYIYNLYVEYVTKNPLYTPATPIRCELFNASLDQYVKNL